jgi:cytochrome P450
MREDAMTDQTPPLVLSLTPLNPEFRENPYAILNALRDSCPVMRDDMAGVFFISRHEDVQTVVKDLTLWRHPSHAEPAAVLTRRMIDEPPVDDRPQRKASILMLDDPDHSRIRQPLSQALYRRAARFRPQVEAIVDKALAALEGKAEFDLMATFALPIPIDVIAAILGVEHDRLAEFREWSEGVIHGLNPLRTEEQTRVMLACSDKLTDYMTALLELRRREPQDDLVTDMVQLQAAGADLADEELVTNLNALLVGGNLTTTDLIGNAVRLFLTHPSELDKLIADPGLMAAAVEEVLRFEPPVDVTNRIASRDLEFGGCPIKPHQSMFVSLRGANRDPAAFENPDRFDITRKKVPHVSFGGGSHICIGAPLARLEAQAALSKLFARYPKMRLADPGAQPEWRTLPFFRGLETLKVAV